VLRRLVELVHQTFEIAEVDWVRRNHGIDASLAAQGTSEAEIARSTEADNEVNDTSPNLNFGKPK